MCLLKEEECFSVEEQIFFTAIELFAEFGVEGVSLSDIATAIGIEVKSIYNYYVSKKELLTSIYRHCVELHRNVEPDLGELLRMAETAPLHQLLGRLQCRLPPVDQAIFDKILLIALHDFSLNFDSAELLRDSLFCPVENIVAPVVSRLIELGRVEPLDVPTFIQVFKNYCFATGVLNSSGLKTDQDAKLKGYAMLFSLIKPAHSDIAAAKL